MDGGNVGDYGLVRQSDSGEGGNFSRVGHSHLHHGKVVCRFESQQPERQTKMIIEIPFGAMHAVLDREQMGHRFFGGSLAHRTGNGDGRLAPNFSHCRRQRLQRDQSVIDGQQASGAGIARQLPLLDHRGNRTPAQRLLDEVVTVEAFAFDREEQFAGLHGAGIDGISLGHGMAVVLAGRRLARRCLVGRSNEFGDARQKKFHAVFPAVPAFAALLQS